MSTLTEHQQKQIAAWCVTHPDFTDQEVADVFQCEPHQVRYAKKKYADLALAQNTVQGKQMLSDLIRNFVDENEELRNQVTKIISDLSTDNSMRPRARLDLIKQVMIIKEKIQKTGLIGHLRTVDAELVAAIIRRFLPNASEEDILKIVNEEKLKLQA